MYFSIIANTQSITEMWTTYPELFL